MVHFAICLVMSALNGVFCFLAITLIHKNRKINLSDPSLRILETIVYILICTYDNFKNMTYYIFIIEFLPILKMYFRSSKDRDLQCVFSSTMLIITMRSFLMQAIILITIFTSNNVLLYITIFQSLEFFIILFILETFNSNYKHNEKFIKNTETKSEININYAGFKRYIYLMKMKYIIESIISIMFVTYRYSEYFKVTLYFLELLIFSRFFYFLFENFFVKELFRYLKLNMANIWIYNITSEEEGIMDAEYLKLKKIKN
ncbi:hypothetical protein GVAV_001680 [Gurleya vavrai]